MSPSDRYGLPDFLSVSDIAALFHVHPKTVYSWGPDQGPPYVKVGSQRRYDPADVRKFIADNKTDGPPHAQAKVAARRARGVA